MTWLDGAITAMLTLGFFLGIWKGVVGLFLPLAGVVVGAWLAGRYFTALSPWLPLSGWPAQVLAFAIIQVLSLMLAALATFALRKLLSWMMLGWLDRLLGALLGLAAVAVGWSLLLSLLIQLPPLEAPIRSSPLASLLVDWLPLHWLPSPGTQ